jgi:hypothetical protein
MLAGFFFRFWEHCRSFRPDFFVYPILSSILIFVGFYSRFPSILGFGGFCIIYGFVDSFLVELKQANEIQKVPGTTSRPCRQPSAWLPPPPGMCKVSVDAALCKTTIAGAVGAICWNENVVFLGAPARVMDGINDPMTLEAFACSEGIALAESQIFK